MFRPGDHGMKYSLFDRRADPHKKRAHMVAAQAVSLFVAASLNFLVFDQIRISPQ